MNRSHITEQTTTTLPRRSERAHDAPAPRALTPATFSGPLQWALEGPGWSFVRPAVDFLLLALATVAALGGLKATVNVDSGEAPLLLLPALVMFLFYLRGLYRTRLRALVLDGIFPVLSGVSVGAMAVATLGLFINGRLPSQTLWVRAWLISLVAS